MTVQLFGVSRPTYSTSSASLLKSRTRCPLACANTLSWRLPISSCTCVIRVDSGAVTAETGSTSAKHTFNNSILSPQRTHGREWAGRSRQVKQRTDCGNYRLIEDNGPRRGQDSRPSMRADEFRKAGGLGIQLAVRKWLFDLRARVTSSGSPSTRRSGDNNSRNSAHGWGA